MIKSLAVLMAFLCACSMPPGGCSKPPESKHVIFITIDTLRRDHVPAYNEMFQVNAPGLERLAKDSIRFDDAWSPISVTGPAFSSMLTGLTPSEHGVLMNSFRGGSPLSEDHETIAEVLVSKGYETAAFLSGYTLRKDSGTGQGFALYDAPEKHRRIARLTTDATIEWLSKKNDKPVFLWYHTYDAHGPLRRWEVPEPPDGFRTGDQSRIPEYQRIDDYNDPRLYKRKYKKAVRWSYKQADRVIEQLIASGMYENSLIVFTTDHGESFTEREVWFDHGTTAYPEQLHIPLLIKLPQAKFAGDIRTDLASLMDIGPTVLKHLGFDFTKDVEGRDLFDPDSSHQFLTGESSHCKRMDALSCGPLGGQGKMVAVRNQRTTVVHHPVKDAPNWEKYNRMRDPRERRPVQTVAYSPTIKMGPNKLSNSLHKTVTSRTTHQYPPLPDLINLDDGTTDPEQLAEIQQMRMLGYVE